MSMSKMNGHGIDSDSDVGGQRQHEPKDGQLSALVRARLAKNIEELTGVIFQRNETEGRLRILISLTRREVLERAEAVAMIKNGEGVKGVEQQKWQQRRQAALEGARTHLHDYHQELRRTLEDKKHAEETLGQLRQLLADDDQHRLIFG